MNDDTLRKASDLTLLERAIRHHAVAADHALDIGDVGSERLHRYLAGSLEAQLRAARKRERRA